jgi:dTMP kinase
MTAGRFLTLEGIDGAGKSSHLDWLAERIRAGGHRVVLTREPGGTELAEALRDLLLRHPMGIQTELLLMFAARQDHLDAVVRPALDRGDWVLCDRFTDSTLAYQGAGRGGPTDRIRLLAEWVHADLVPDRTYLFDLPADEAARRRARARAADRFESEDVAFFERVRSGYCALAAAAPERIRILDASLPIDRLRKLIADDLRDLR